MFICVGEHFNVVKKSQVGELFSKLGIWLSHLNDFKAIFGTFYPEIRDRDPDRDGTSWVEPERDRDTEYVF